MGERQEDCKVTEQVTNSQTVKIRLLLVVHSVAQAPFFDYHSKQGRPDRSGRPYIYI